MAVVFNDATNTLKIIVDGVTAATAVSVPNSLISSAQGLVIGGIAAAEGIATVDVLPERLRDVRKDLPCLEHRRYQIALNPSGDNHP